MPPIACPHAADSDAERSGTALREPEPAGMTLGHIVHADLPAETAGTGAAAVPSGSSGW